MTDPETANRTYVGPMTPELVEQILIKEKPDALLPTMGGQTALNLTKSLAEDGILEKHGVELIGAKLDAINKAEDRQLFKEAMEKIGLKTPPSGTANTWDEAIKIADYIGSFPLIIRPAFTLGGSGGGIAYNMEEFKTIVTSGLNASSTTQVLIEKSLLGWKEYELEVMRDLADNVVIVCSIENLDPMGVHTGDSITIAPAQTLTDKEYQRLRDASVDIIREIGVECGGSNVQMAVNPEDGELMIIEMNPRVSRSSALASKATGFPIAKMAAKLAVGCTLDGIPNDITLKTPASFEPSIDYVITKIPRFAFEKFPGSDPILTTQMKSVGEAMAVGRTWQESFNKALRSLETGLSGWGLNPKDGDMQGDIEAIKEALSVPNPSRVVAIHEAFMAGMTAEEIHKITAFDPWFLRQMDDLFQTEQWLKSLNSLSDLDTQDWSEVKRRGFSDIQIARAFKVTEGEVRKARVSLGVTPSMKRVDTCAAEFEASTPYMYSSYDGNDEVDATDEKKILILGGGPNRIGQGIEFDYCCCHAAFALKDAGYETIMLNSNPETVSTDYDTSDRLYFEPLTVEDVLNVVEAERPEGIIVQFGGQTPLSLATRLEKALTDNPIPAASGNGNCRILGTPPDSIDAAEDRERWQAILNELEILQPPGGVARSESEALVAANNIGYPVMVRPSFVLGGRAMEIVTSDADLKRYIRTAVEVDPEKPVLVDKYLSNATELDVDALCDAEGNVVISGILEHIEQAGVHSGDSACSIPTQTIPESSLATIREWTPKVAKRLGVIGLINIQYAVIPDGTVYIIEANPRASRTVPFVAKAIGHPIAKYASLIMAGATLKELNFTEEVKLNHVAVKEAVLPFDKFPGADTLLGPEMRSTGEVMGIDRDFNVAYAKAQIAAGQRLPTSGKVFISVRDSDKPAILDVAKQFHELGMTVVATGGTAKTIEAAGVPVTVAPKIHEGRPHIGDMLRDGDISLMIVTSSGDEADMKDGREIRRTAVGLKVPLVTTVAGAKATCSAVRVLQEGALTMQPLQDFF
jgi:carbamoyl-phosphate synthase large subunit|tara:strand:+ start:2574 stop:5678 length:3105 start_codon:yes stop_codon:yes gene_type:complete